MDRERQQGILDKPLSRRDLLRGAGALGAGLALGAAMPSVAGAATRRAASAKQVAFAYPYTSVQVYQPILKGALAEAAKLNVQLLQSNSQLNSGAQLAELDTWIAEGVGAIVILPLDYSALGPVIPKAHKAGVKILGYAVKLPGEDGFLLWNDAAGAKAVGNAAAQWVNTHKRGKAEVGLLTQQAVEVGRTRINGAVAALKKAAPGAKIVASTEAPDNAHALVAVRDMLQAHPNLSVIICVNDDDEVGAARAIIQAGKNPKNFFLTGMDGSLTALQMIKSGQINGVTGALPLYDIGVGVTQFAADAMAGRRPTSKVFNYVLATNHNPAVVQQLISAYGTKK